MQEVELELSECDTVSLMTEVTTSGPSSHLSGMVKRDPNSNCFSYISGGRMSQSQRKWFLVKGNLEEFYSNNHIVTQYLLDDLWPLFFQDQFEQHIHQDFHVNIYVYYGSDRSKDPSVLSEQDIVLTTYNILATDYGVSK